MGICCSGPLPKVTGGPGRTGVLAGPTYEESIRQQQEYQQDENIPKSYFSFQAFFAENKVALIYEWHFLKEIGKGATSVVYLCQNTETNETCAAKIYNSTNLRKKPLGGEEAPLLAVQREIQIMYALGHRYILSITEVIEDDYTNSYILIMPFARNGTLQHLLNTKNIDNRTLSICFFQVAEAFRYIHSKNIVHRDLKPENILSVDKNYFLVSDFGVSTKLESPDQLLEDTQGSPAFLSPEECSGKPFLPKPADVWAYGVTLYSAIFGKLPFNIDAGQEAPVSNIVMIVTSMLQKNELTFPENVSVDSNILNLLRAILNKDPTQRPSFEEITKNPWFAEARELDHKFLEEEEMFEEEEEIPQITQMQD